ncbi:NADAR family protein [Deinococcus radiomollis]|uniref:NADAR family protein n=1 Tax=Deinococcus radiomollis TaxID=468916 RepID=UPI003891E777
MPEPENIIFFYRSSHPFSNFYPSKFVAHDLLFHWAEQYIMYRKALHFGDTQTAAQIMTAFTPAECKTLGRRVRGFEEGSWARVLEQMAAETISHKFSANRKLRAVLLQTGDALLVEASPSDRIWGIGFAEQDALDYRFQWGENILGMALMRVRKQLRSEL